MPAIGSLSVEDLLRNTEEMFCSARSKDLRCVVTQIIEDLRHYDVSGMNRVAAIEPWGRSGSLLLASYLDGHEDVIMLPALRSNQIYPFFALYPSLSLQQKLLSYPVYDRHHGSHSEAAGCGRSYFEGPFAISPDRYLAAVIAVCAKCEELPPEFTKSRRAFFIFVHLAYTLALGRHLASATPLIVCAQHEWDSVRAPQFLEDFPEAKYIHTVRDPISSVDRLFAWFFDADLLPDRQPSDAERMRVPAEARSARYISLLAPMMVMRLLTDSDRANIGGESRTRAIRFEDMHATTADTMQDVAAWLGLAYQPSLTESTFNGIPYIVTSDGKTWSGSRRSSVRRESRNLALRDRLIVFALFHENFVAWKYPYPRIFDRRSVRTLTLMAGAFLPMKMETMVARAAWRRRVWPWLRRGNVKIPLDTLMRLIFCRLAVFGFIAREMPRRLLRRRPALQLRCDREASMSASAG